MRMFDVRNTSVICVETVTPASVTSKVSPTANRFPAVFATQTRPVKDLKTSPVVPDVTPRTSWPAAKPVASETFSAWLPPPMLNACASGPSMVTSVNVMLFDPQETVNPFSPPFSEVTLFTVAPLTPCKMIWSVVKGFSSPCAPPVFPPDPSG